MLRSTSLPAALLGVATTVARSAGQTRPRPGPLRWRPRPGFYEQAADPGTGVAGEVVDHEPVDAFLLPGLRLRAATWRLLHRSTRLDGSPTLVSATLLVPPGTVRGLVAYAPGTHGLANYAAPSRLVARGLDWETAFVARLLSMGHAVVMTDYEGLGTPGDHPYVIGRTLGRNVLDALRAARSFAAAALPDDVPHGVFGYSEGGHASAWAAELHPVYAPDLPLAGVASGSVPADLEATGDHVEGSMYSFFAGYGALGLNAAYPELDLPRFLTAEGERHMDRLRRSSVVTATLRGPHFVGVDELMTENVLRRPDWQARMRENSLGTTAPVVPVYLYTSRRDPLVPPAQTRDLAVRWRARGADVTLTEVPALEHVTGMVLGGDGAARWLDRTLRRARGTSAHTSSAAS